MSRKVLGISAFYHDAAAALVIDGDIVAAAQEERFTRVKFDPRFPKNAVYYCCEQAGITIADVDSIVYYDKPLLTFDRLLCSYLAVAPRNLKSWTTALPRWLSQKLFIPTIIRKTLGYEGEILTTPHHLSHAASAFYPSPFSDAAILTIDGVGEWATATLGIGEGKRIQICSELRFPHSLGLLYAAFTYFCGFKVNSGEYKLMGLAPYGEPIYSDLILEKLVTIHDDGSLSLNQEYFDYVSGMTMTNDKFAKLFGGPARCPESRITKREMDLAASIQAVTEMILLRMVAYLHQLTGKKNLCLAGGVALNCVANSKILARGPFEQLWIQPAAGDAGGALGAALAVVHGYEQRPRVPRGRDGMHGGYLGPAYAEEEIAAFLKTHEYPHRFLAKEERATTVAQCIADGGVVGFFSGRMEFGPRALGARSILGDPRCPDTQTVMNLKIKYRESFRPFAPAVLAEHAHEYFDLDVESPYMLLVAPVTQRRRIARGELPHDGDLLPAVSRPRSDIPAVTHWDYSARLQTVGPHDHPEFYALMKAFHALTGCPIIVNTSFNVRGEPIVCTPFDAYRCFMRTNMDALYLDGFWLIKSQQPHWGESADWQRTLVLD